jgi:hypothetical protein
VSKVAQREADYKALIESANQKIQALNAQAQTCPSVPEIVNNADNTGVVENQNTLTADEALALAVQSSGNDQVLSGTPELVSFQGTPAFEIPFADGMMYIDASSGNILSSTAQTSIGEQQAIDAMANYLGVKNTSRAVVEQAIVDGIDYYKVFINNYVVFVDQYGAVTKLQVYHY